MEKLYTPKEIAQITRYSIYTARQKINQGEFGPTLNNGKQHLVYESGLKAYLERNTGEPVTYTKALGGGSAPKKVRKAPEKLSFI